MCYTRKSINEQGDVSLYLEKVLKEDSIPLLFLPRWPSPVRREPGELVRLLPLGSSNLPLGVIYKNHKILKMIDQKIDWASICQ